VPIPLKASRVGIAAAFVRALAKATTCGCPVLASATFQECELFFWAMRQYDRSGGIVM
jgi:hypothetical protein